MADGRYLKQQGEAWYFCMTVPKALRSAFPSEGRRAPGGRRLAGKPREKIVIALGTQSLSEAKERRWPLVHEWREKFKRAKAKVPITITEIEDAAREQYTYLLECMAADAERGKYDGPPVYGPDGVTVMFTPEEASIDAALDAAGTALEEEAWEQAEAEVRRIERQKGVAIERDSPTHKLLAKAILTAQVEALEGRLRLLSGKTSEPPVTFLGSAGIDPVTLRPIASLPRPVTRIRTSDGITFEEAVARYLDELRSSSITAQTLLRTERVFALFKSYAGNPPLAAIDKDTAHDFITKVASLDPAWGNRERPDKMTFAKLIETFGQGKRHLSNATINKYVHSLSALFSWAERKTNFEGRNPFRGQSRAKPDPKQTGWKAYNIDELNKLFAVRPERAELWWLPLIALYSGLRLGEICQLRTGDVVRKKGIWCFEVSASGDGQHVKTDAAVRIVPMHSKLIEAGLLDYHKSRDGRLWPGLRRGGPDNKLGWNFSAQFTEYRRACGVDAPRLVFHSFRKNAAQALKNKRATPAEIAELIGHERGFTVETYAPLGLPLPALQELVERIEYPGLRLKHLYAG